MLYKIIKTNYMFQQQQQKSQMKDSLWIILFKTPMYSLLPTPPHTPTSDVDVLNQVAF